jgi:RNA polymerase sigma-70 factor (ECF subfamily)
MAERPNEAIDWGAFYLRHRRALFVYALSLAGSTDAAHDLLQEVFARLLAERAAPNVALAYALRCVRNLAIDRRRARRTTTPLDAVTTTEFLADARPEESQGLADSVRAALAALPDSQREPIVLRVFAGLTIEQAADVLGRPFGTVASAYSRGLAALRQRLTGVLEDDRRGARTDARQLAHPGA